MVKMLSLLELRHVLFTARAMLQAMKQRCSEILGATKACMESSRIAKGKHLAEKNKYYFRHIE
jgi:hypothetical protein